MKLIYFAWIREKVGQSSEEIELPPGVKTVSDLLDWQQSRGENYADAFALKDTIKTAINQTHVENEAIISDASEIAFFPPVTGG